MAVRVLINRPALPAALRALGVLLSDAADAAVVVVDAGALDDARCCPAARVLAVASDEAQEHAALLAGADDVARGSDALVSLRARRLLAPAATIAIGTLHLDRVARTATRDGRRLALLPREFALLDLLARHPGTTVHHAELRRELLGLCFHPGTNVLAVHVSRLRRALDGEGGGGSDGAPAMLRTDRGRGYRLVPDHPVPR